VRTRRAAACGWGLALASALALEAGCTRKPAERGEVEDVAEPETAAVPLAKEALARTAVLPTLDTPIPAGKSALWCSSFQLAWDELKKLAGGPILVENAEEPAARLNDSRWPEDDLPPGAGYARAGFAGYTQLGARTGVHQGQHHGDTENYLQSLASSVPPCLRGSGSFVPWQACRFHYLSVLENRE
jgi:hypothetical protein